ncbi:Ap1g1 [Symbiodinium sp. KB8]|nr:Ap1g1 [Symbiodinium sp. KB8]
MLWKGDTRTPPVPAAGEGPARPAATAVTATAMAMAMATATAIPGGGIREEVGGPQVEDSLPGALQVKEHRCTRRDMLVLLLRWLHCKRRQKIGLLSMAARSHTCSLCKDDVTLGVSTGVPTPTDVCLRCRSSPLDFLKQCSFAVLAPVPPC